MLEGMEEGHPYPAKCQGGTQSQSPRRTKHRSRHPAASADAEVLAFAGAAGLPRADYNGRDRGGAAGVVSLTPYTTRRGKRSSTSHAFLAGEPERRPNLTILTGAQATRVLVAGATGPLTAQGVEYRTAAGERRTASARTAVILSAWTIGSPHVLLLSGIGPRRALEAVGVPGVVDAPMSTSICKIIPWCHGAFPLLASA